MFCSDYSTKGEMCQIINHKDENKSNNNFQNLEWCTTEFNNRYSFNLHRNRIKAMQTQEINKIRGKSKRKVVIQLDKENNIINKFDGVISASKITGFDKSTISNCCRGIYKYAYGFKWKYV